MLNVAKFGGTSVADHEAMLRCAQIIKSQVDTRVVVVSASAGVTNHLVTLAQQPLSDVEQASIIADIQTIQYNITQHLPVAEQQLNEQVSRQISAATDQVTKVKMATRLVKQSGADYFLAHSDEMGLSDESLGQLLL